MQSAMGIEASAYVDDIRGGIFPKQEKNLEKITASEGEAVKKG